MKFFLMVVILSIGCCESRRKGSSQRKGSGEILSEFCNNSKICQCPAGFNGSTCNQDIDDCSPNPCKNGGACTELRPSGNPAYSCDCPNGFTGTNCDNDVDECASNPCQNGGICVQPGLTGSGEYKCLCTDGFRGINCQEDINECDSLPCQNNGNCIEGNFPGNYSCTCPNSWTGRNCEIDSDECSQNPCVNNGTCLQVGPRGSGEWKCGCVDGYGGDTCEKDKCWKLLVADYRHNIYEVDAKTGKAELVIDVNSDAPFKFAPQIAYNPNDGKLYRRSGKNSDAFLERIDPHPFQQTDLEINAHDTAFKIGSVNAMTYDNVRRAFLFKIRNQEIYKIDSNGKTNEVMLSSPAYETASIVRSGNLIYTAGPLDCDTKPCIVINNATTLEKIGVIHLSPDLGTASFSDEPIFNGLAIHPETKELFGNIDDDRNSDKYLLRINVQSGTATRIADYDGLQSFPQSLTFVPCSFLTPKNQSNS